MMARQKIGVAKDDRIAETVGLMRLKDKGGPEGDLARKELAARKRASMKRQGTAILGSAGPDANYLEELPEGIETGVTAPLSPGLGGSESFSGGSPGGSLGGGDVMGNPAGGSSNGGGIGGGGGGGGGDGGDRTEMMIEEMVARIMMSQAQELQRFRDDIRAELLAAHETSSKRTLEVVEGLRSQLDAMRRVKKSKEAKGSPGVETRSRPPRVLRTHVNETAAGAAAVGVGGPSNVGGGVVRRTADGGVVRRTTVQRVTNYTTEETTPPSPEIFTAAPQRPGTPPPGGWGMEGYSA